MRHEQTRHTHHAQVIALVKEKRLRQTRPGTRKLQYLLQESLRARHIKLGRDGLFAVLRANCWLVPCKRACQKTTHSYHRFYKYLSRLKAGSNQVIASKVEQVWVAEITYIRTQEKYVYLSLVTDVYSRKNCRSSVHASLQTEEVSHAFKSAIIQRGNRSPLIYHSDRRIQYCFSYYQSIHIKNDITCSMTDGYDCYQNALAERVNGILKNEFLLFISKDLKAASQMIKQSIDIYNQERPHCALKYKTPGALHQASLQHF